MTFLYVTSPLPFYNTETLSHYYYIIRFTKPNVKKFCQTDNNIYHLINCTIIFNHLIICTYINIHLLYIALILMYFCLVNKYSVWYNKANKCTVILEKYMNLEMLNDQQREAVLHDKGPLLILAGAGSGKTRVITHRIAYLIRERGVSPYSILAITFTNKAAGEMKERVNKLVEDVGADVWVATFHSTCVRILRRFIDTIGYDRNFSIYDADDQKALMKLVLKSLNIDSKQIKEKTFINAISNLKSECITAEEYINAPYVTSFGDRQIAKVYYEYEKRLKENNALDFDDLLLKTVILFRQNPDALEYYRDKFEYIMVDEYQDTNNVQFKFIELLASHRDADGRIYHNLCVVGDDDQSIYKFRGADITNILSFEKRFTNAKIIKLEQNYRSTGNILNLANEVISHNEGRKQKRLWTSFEDGEMVTFSQYNTDYDEASGIVSGINEKMADNPSLKYNSFAVLYRTNAQSRILEETMVRRSIPYRIVGGVNFYQRKEIKDILAYLKTIDNGLDALSIERIINIPKRGIGDTSVANVRKYADSLNMGLYDALLCAEINPSVSRAAAKIKGFTDVIEGLKKQAEQLPVSRLIDEIIETIGYEDYLDDYDHDKIDERIENIHSLIDKAVLYEEQSGDEATLSGFLAEVALLSDIDSTSPDEDCVLLMTLHSAKGLEFDHVFMCGMEDGLFPNNMCIEEPDELEEERRLCYVGITRAKKTLALTCAKQRMTHGQLNYSNISRFIAKDIPRHMLSMKGHANESYLKSTCNPQSSYIERPVSSFIVQSGRDAAKNNPYKSQSVIKPQSSASALKVGDRVKHIRFGEGTITDVAMGSKDIEYTIDFNGNVKRMLASFARLNKI